LASSRSPKMRLASSWLAVSDCCLDIPIYHSKSSQAALI
jgi:hypothetical protein